MIDIGHGGTDTGATGNGLVEKDLNLKAGLSLRDFLNKFDADVRTTRDSDITLSSDARVALVKAFNPDLCISVHHNAASTPDARGAEVINAYYDQRDDKLANSILNNLEAIGMPKRSTYTRLNSRGQDWYFMIRRIWNNNTQAIIVEGGFVTNKADADMLKSDNYLMSEANAIGIAVADYMKLSLKEAPKDTPKETPNETPAKENWWEPAMNRIKAAGLIEGNHEGDAPVTWAELAAVLSRLLDKLNI